MLTNRLFLVVVDEEGVKDFNPFFGEPATVPGYMSGRHGARRRRVTLTRRRLESIPVVVHEKHPDARDVRPPEPSRSTSCQRQRTPTDGIRPTTS
jgi:hypothetical protein